MKRLIIAVIAIVFLAGCGDEPEKAKSTTDYNINVKIDTLIIHGNRHEVLFWYYGHGGGMMHSPECWCEEGGAR